MMSHDLSSLWSVLPRSLRGIGAGLSRLAAVEPSSGLLDDLVGGGSPLTYQVLGDAVAVLPIVGAIAKSRPWWGGVSSRDAIAQIRKAQVDDRVGAIMLRIDSPGGTVAGTPEFGAAVAEGPKPVHAYIEDLGASAAYWIASQAKSITANATAEVGSLGTLAVVEDMSGMAEGLGLKVHVISTGEAKGDLVPGAPVTDAALERVRAIVEGLNRHFVEAVRRGREMTPAAVHALWTGETWLAAEAKALGLIDRVEPFEAAVERVARPIREARAGRARSRLAQGQIP